MVPWSLHLHGWNLLRRISPPTPILSEFEEKANQLLDSVPNLLLDKRKPFGGKRIPFEQFVENKLDRFKHRAAGSPIVEGIAGPVTQEAIYLLCNGQKRMGKLELEKSWESLELWGSINCDEEETIAIEFMKSVLDRNSGKLDIARERIETKVLADGLNKATLGSNDWISGFAYYEVFLLLLYFW